MNHEVSEFLYEVMRGWMFISLTKTLGSACMSFIIPSNSIQTQLRSMNENDSEGSCILGSLSDPGLSFVLLQHEKEVNRPSGTAKLVLEESYVTRWKWSGRNDNDYIRKRLLELKGHNDEVEIYLVWIGGEKIQTCFANQEDFAKQKRIVYIILDGTWKEAQTMFRKNPFLISIPRVTLDDFQTSYNIRADYTDWRKKNSKDMNKVNNECHLLCTAETVAAILSLRDLADHCSTIHSRLDAFQQKFRKGLHSLES